MQIQCALKFLVIRGLFVIEYERILLNASPWKPSRQNSEEELSIKIGKYDFEGPFTSTRSLKNASGIYAILCERNGSRHVIDIGESSTVKDRIESHDRKECWTRNCQGGLSVAVLYTTNLPSTYRLAIERELRAQYSPACGVR